MATKLGSRDIKKVSIDKELEEMMQDLNEERPRVISVDAEGRELCRNGTMSLLALCWNDQTIYVIDVQVLFHCSLLLITFGV